MDMFKIKFHAGFLVTKQVITFNSMLILFKMQIQPLCRQSGNETCSLTLVKLLDLTYHLITDGYNKVCTEVLLYYT